MNDTHRYAQAYRTIAAGMKILREHAKDAGLPIDVTDLLYATESRIADEIPPWSTEPAAQDLPWSNVIPGDEVQAPSGVWYPVDSVARIGERMSVLLVSGAAKIPSKPKAGDRVSVRRGDAGRAVDIFRAGGLDLTTMERAA